MDRTKSRSMPCRPGKSAPACSWKASNRKSLMEWSPPQPLGRIAEAEEIAGIVVFLASRHAGYITGATINVSGGFLMY